MQACNGYGMIGLGNARRNAVGTPPDLRHRQCLCLTLALALTVSLALLPLIVLIVLIVIRINAHVRHCIRRHAAAREACKRNTLK
jgi:hypothetical protein